ncbi:MAG: hypothetical protein DMF84_08830 [Acidobacteria bacterium]|nr:MAG: hypothetical protein DMF84_08830 [Acidobacteriota bacterium]
MTDWTNSRDSVRRLAAPAPSILVAGHGQPMSGEAMRERALVRACLRSISTGSRVRASAGTRRSRLSGVVRLPPDPLPKILAGIGAIAAMAGLVRAARATVRRRQVAA